MDATTRRAVEHYNQLLGDGEARALQEELLERMQAAGLSFGGRVLCPFLRPHLIAPGTDRQIRGVCESLFRAVEKVADLLGEELWERVDLTPEERDLVTIDPGYRRLSPNARLDSFLTPTGCQFVELNAETPAGLAYYDVLAELFLELPLVKRFQERYVLRSLPVRRLLLDTLLACYREAGGTLPRPCIAVVDYEDVPTRSEHVLFRDFFESCGYPALICDPRQLEYTGGRLQHAGQAIDIVYKRLLVNELLERATELQALLRAAREHAVTVVNPFRCKPIHKKAIFAVLTDDELQGLFTPGERTAIRAHVPWTRRVADGRCQRDGRDVELLAFIRRRRQQLVLKPNDEYGGKGVFMGHELSAGEWDTAIDEALRSSYVVQERVELLRESFPVLGEQLTRRELVVDIDPFLFNGSVGGYLTRLSETSLANVSSGGGQVPAFVVEPR